MGFPMTAMRTTKLSKPEVYFFYPIRFIQLLEFCRRVAVAKTPNLAVVPIGKPQLR